MTYPYTIPAERLVAASVTDTEGNSTLSWTVVGTVYGAFGSVSAFEREEATRRGQSYDARYASKTVVPIGQRLDVAGHGLYEVVEHHWTALHERHLLRKVDDGTS